MIITFLTAENSTSWAVNSVVYQFLYGIYYVSIVVYNITLYYDMKLRNKKTNYLLIN